MYKEMYYTYIEVPLMKILFYGNFFQLSITSTKTINLFLENIIRMHNNMRITYNYIQW